MSSCFYALGMVVGSGLVMWPSWATSILSCDFSSLHWRKGTTFPLCHGLKKWEPRAAGSHNPDWQMKQAWCWYPKIMECWLYWDPESIVPCHLNPCNLVSVRQCFLFWCEQGSCWASVTGNQRALRAQPERDKDLSAGGSQFNLYILAITWALFLVFWLFFVAVLVFELRTSCCEANALSFEPCHLQPLLF
jgi:hypothetical protein